METPDLHGYLLGQQFDVVRGGAALQDKAVILNQNAQIANASTQAAVHLHFELLKAREHRAFLLITPAEVPRGLITRIPRPCRRFLNFPHPVDQGTEFVRWADRVPPAGWGLHRAP